MTSSLAYALSELGPASDLTVGTLNYDGLTHAGLMSVGNAAFQIADLAEGHTEANLSLFGTTALSANWLREFDDIPTGRAAVLHLHGYLGWLRDPSSGRVAKFTLDDLRDEHYWERFAAGETDWEPVVVLTDRKDRATVEWPFQPCLRKLPSTPGRS